MDNAFTNHEWLVAGRLLAEGNIPVTVAAGPYSLIASKDTLTGFRDSVKVAAMAAPDYALARSFQPAGYTEDPVMARRHP